jgi:antirestriction protein
MNTTTETTPRIYVGTYEKYNNGSIKGAWLDLEGLDKDSFYDACKELHKDEADPEYMFQDFEGFPRRFYGESSLEDGLWAWLELDEEERELLEVASEAVDSEDIDDAREKFMGKYDSEKDWAENYLEETGELNEIPQRLRYYFDYEAYARDARMGGDICFHRHNGDTWVFSNH